MVRAQAAYGGSANINIVPPRGLGIGDNVSTFIERNIQKFSMRTFVLSEAMARTRGVIRAPGTNATVRQKTGNVFVIMLNE